MIIWDDILLLSSTIYVIIILLSVIVNHKESEYWLYFIASVCFAGSISINILEYYWISGEALILTGHLYDWFRVIAISCVLTSLALLIRKSKPKLTQFPVILAFIPILLILGHYFVMNTLVLKEWLLAIYQGGALFIALIMFSLLSIKSNQLTLILAGVLVLLISYLTYWVQIPLFADIVWIWKCFAALGLIISVKGVQIYAKSDFNIG